MLRTSRDHCPDPFAPAVSLFTPCPLRDQTVDHHEPDRLLRQVVGRLHSRGRDEPEITLPMLLEPPRQVATVFIRRHVAPGTAQHLGPRCLELALELLGSQPLPAVDHPKEISQCLAQPRPILLGPRIGQCREVLHVANQVSQTELERHVELALVTPIGREIVTPQNPVELRAQNLDQHIGTPRRVDLEERVQVGPKAPDPLPQTILLVTGLVDVEIRFFRQTRQQFFIGLLQRLTHLGDDVRQLPTRDGQPHNVANELADGGEGCVANSLEVGNHGGKPGPDQTAAFDADGQRGLELLLTVRAPPWVAAMLLDLQRHVLNVNLLDHPGHNRRHGFQVMAATGTEIEAIVDRRAVDRFRREGSAFVLGVTGLSADVASILALWRLRLGRLDDVGGRRL